MRRVTESHPVHFIDPGGNPFGVDQIDNKLRTSSSPHAYDIARGRVSDSGFVRIAGHNGNVGATSETVWSVGGLYPWPIETEILKVSSNDLADDGVLSGNGARTILLIGYDANYVPQVETMVLNGSTPIPTTKAYSRVYKARVLSAGDSGWNEGTISVKDNDNTVTLLVIEPARNESLMAIFTIPNGYTGFITSWSIATSSNKVVNGEIYIRPYGQVFQCKAFVEINLNPYKEPWEFPETVPEKSDIELRANTAGGGGAVSGGFSLGYQLNS